MKLLNSFKIKSEKVNEESFDTLALEVFRFQAIHNKVYEQYLSALAVDVANVKEVSKIPFLPIEFFKTQKVVSGEWEAEHQFLSSGTSSMDRGRHYVQDVSYYLHHARTIFENQYQALEETVFFALLPSYQQQGNSSLIQMVDSFMNLSRNQKNVDEDALGGYYLENYESLLSDIQRTVKKHRTQKKVVLFGVGYALLDFADYVQHIGVDLSGLTIIETGGMKGRRKEMVKSEFYALLKKSMGGICINSEYGMTELLSQAYGDEQARFTAPAQMKVVIRDVNDPFTMLENGSVGGINIIDLANIHSCSFIETKDMGRVFDDGQFEIVGRIDNSDIRGCNLLVI